MNDSRISNYEKSTTDVDNHISENPLVHERENESKSRRHLIKTTATMSSKVCNDTKLKEKKSLLPENISKLQSRIEELQKRNDKLRNNRKEIKQKLEEAMSELTNVRKLNE